MKSTKIILYSSVFAIQGLCNALIPVLPELAGNAKGTSAWASSLLFSGYFLGAFLTMLPFGVLADRFGNSRFIGLGVGLTALSGVSLSFTENLWVLGFFRFVEGIGCGAFFPAAFSMLAESENTQQNIGEFTFLLNAGLAAGVFFAGFLAGQGPKTAIQLFTLISLFPACLLLYRSREWILGPETSFCSSEAERKDQLEKPAGFISSPGFLSSLKRSFPLLFEKVLFENSFGKIWGTSVLLYGTTGILTANYPEYSASFLTKPELGLAISASYGAAMLGSFVVGRVSIGYKNIVRGGIITAAAGILAAGQFPLLAFILMGAGGGVAFVGLAMAISALSPTGFAMGLFNTGIYAGLGIVPMLGSAFVDTVSFETLFAGCALVLLSTLLIRL